MDFRDMYLYEVQYEFNVKEKMERAEHDRLVRSLVAHKRRSRFYYPAVARLGRWLMVSGRYLRRRYGRPVAIPTSQPAQRSA